jgi:superfamily II DNA or RNA helicase
VRTKRVTILRSHNRIAVDPTTDAVYDLLAPALTYTERIFLHGKELYRARENRLPEVIDQEWECFDEDHKKRLTTFHGYCSRIVKVLKAAGYVVDYKLLTPHPRPEAFEPNWKRVFALAKLRHKQDDFLVKVLTYDCGRIDCPTGWGKTFAMGLAAAMLTNARIDVVTRSVTLLTQSIYPELCGMLPSVGLVGGGHKLKGQRVMCYSIDSLLHSDFKADVVFLDEGHELCSDKAVEKLARYRYAHMWMLSASQDMRLDKKDFRMEGFCGPIRLKIPYREAQEHGAVVPIRVIWRDVDLDINPCEDCVDVEKKRLGLWANDQRNTMIAEDARLYDANTQVIVYCETVEHILHLHRYLPEFTPIYGENAMTFKKLERFRKEGLIDKHFRPMTVERRDRLTKLAMAGKLNKIIVSTVFRVGINLRYLTVLVRADGGSSDVASTQVPGRTSRTIEGKVEGIIHDYRDNFDRGFQQKSAKRERLYAYHQWTQDHAKPERVQDEELFWEMD